MVEGNTSSKSLLNCVGGGNLCSLMGKDSDDGCKFPCWWTIVEGPTGMMLAPLLNARELEDGSQFSPRSSDAS